MSKGAPMLHVDVKSALIVNQRLSESQKIFRNICLVTSNTSQEKKKTQYLQIIGKKNWYTNLNNYQSIWNTLSPLLGLLLKVLSLSTTTPILHFTTSVTKSNVWLTRYMKFILWQWSRDKCLLHSFKTRHFNNSKGVSQLFLASLPRAKLWWI